MKKFLVLLLGFCFAVPAFAGTIGAVSNEAWLDHVSQMQSLRQQIMALVTKSNPTVEDRQNLDLLNLTFAEKKAEWEQYLESVAQGKQTETEVKDADEPAKVEKAEQAAPVKTARADFSAKAVEVYKMPDDLKVTFNDGSTSRFGKDTWSKVCQTVPDAANCFHPGHSPRPGSLPSCSWPDAAKSSADRSS